MNFALLLEKWCGLSAGDPVVIVTDQKQNKLAETIARDIAGPCSVLLFEDGRRLMPEIKKLPPNHLLAALFSFDTYLNKGANRVFSPFEKPKGVQAKYAFIRLDISEESLLQGLSTPKGLVYRTLSDLQTFPAGSVLRVTNAAGTDISLAIDRFTTCAHEITIGGGMAFLPPSEASAVVLPGKASGLIAVDITVGQLYLRGELLGRFGLVDEPVRLTVAHGMATDIQGGAMAAELREKLFALPPECRALVELGHGLSEMAPTGLIGVDESILHTCHFGFGDGGTCGVHLDVVISKPTITKTG